MHLVRIFVATCLGLLLYGAPAVAAALSGGTLPGGYSSWPVQTLSCSIKPNVRVDLFVYTDRGAEAINRAVSVWHINGMPFEVKYFEPVADNMSLSGYRASGFTIVLDREEKWIKLGELGRTMDNRELLLLRVLRYAQLNRHGVSEGEFTKGWASCNKNRPGILR